MDADAIDAVDEGILVRHGFQRAGRTPRQEDEDEDQAMKKAVLLTHHHGSTNSTVPWAGMVMTSTSSSRVRSAYSLSDG